MARVCQSGPEGDRRFPSLFCFSFGLSPFLHPLPGSRDPNSKRKEEERKREREEEIEIEMGGTDLDLSLPSPLSLFGFDLSLLLLHFPRPNWKGGRPAAWPGLSWGREREPDSGQNPKPKGRRQRGIPHTHTHTHTLSLSLFPNFSGLHTHKRKFILRRRRMDGRGERSVGWRWTKLLLLRRFFFSLRCRYGAVSGAEFPANSIRRRGPTFLGTEE